MALYTAAVNRAGVNAVNTVLAELRASASARCTVREVGISMAVLPTAAPRFVLARPTNTPAGGTNNVPVPHDAADGASLSSFFLTGQTTVPTFATAGPWPKVAGLPLTLGAGLIWTFGGAGLLVPLSGSLLIANLNASGTTLGSFDMYMTWEE
jgi:hypothetical protein